MAYSYEYDCKTYQPSRHDAYSNRSNSRDSYGHSRYSTDNNSRNPPNKTPMTRSSSGHSRYDNDYNRSYSAQSAYREQNLPPPPPRHWEDTPVVTDRRQARSVNRRRWPPQAIVEDQAVSLAKEWPQSRLHDNSDEVCMRGAVDQDPIMIELDNGERRFVLVPIQDDNSSKKGESRPKEKKPARALRQKETPPPLRLDIDETHIFAPRQPSPYAFTRTPKTPTNRHSGDYFLSPDILTPPSSTISNSRPQKDAFEPIKKQSAFNGLGKSGSRSEHSDESDLDAAHTAKLRSRRSKPRVSFHGTNKTTPKPYSSDLSEHENHRSTRTQSMYNGEKKTPIDVPRSVPSNSSNDDPSRPTSRALPIPKTQRSESMYTSRPSRNEFARPNSPLGDAFLRTPPESPKLAPRGSIVSPRGSVSKPVSRANSRPSSPLASSLDLNQASFILSRSPNSQADRSATYPPSTQERSTRPTSKLSSSVRQESVETLKAPPRIDIQSPWPVRPVTKPPLPYPDDRPNVLMPSHEHFQVRPAALSASFEPKPISRPPSNTSTTPLWTASLRPTLTSRHTLNEEVPKIRAQLVRTASHDSISCNQSTGTSSPVLPKLPPCPRKEYSRKHDDWYTLEGEPSFDVCPHCMDEIVRPSAFRRYFKRAAPRSSIVRTRCDFGSPWIRLAWLLTLKRQRQDIDLIYALAAIANVQPECSGAQEPNTLWYGLRDQNGEFVANFAVCSCDLKYLEALFPSLLGAFSRLPQVSNLRTSHVCSLRIDSRRFTMYLDLIVNIDDKARSSPRASVIPDLKPLYDLLDSHAYKLECPRDRIVLAQAWHFIPSLPDLTICEECYDEAVWPHVTSGSELASRFNRVLMPVPPTATSKFEGGASCQLYSPRMRRVWDRAMRYGDDEGYRYLVKKARERKNVEEDLRSQQVSIKRALDQRGTSGLDKESLRKELERIESEWAEWE